MKSEIFVFFHGLEKWVHAFFNTFSWDFSEKEINIGVTKRFKKIDLEVTSFRLSYSNYYLNGCIGRITTHYCFVGVI